MSDFNPLDYPVCLENPLRLAYPWAWVEHIPFAMLLMDITRPKLLVELGTHSGNSYCAFCQAIKSVGIESKCYAVDTWKGDEHAGFYGPEILANLRAYHDSLYGDFSRLVQSKFDDAVKYFSDGSIDVLHIDGLHTFDAVKYDFETWLPKLSERAVILLHDINVREQDFGVWKLWELLSTNYPSFSFTHGHGLGVLAIGKKYPKKLNVLLEMREHDLTIFREIFYKLGRQLIERLENQQVIQELKGQLVEIEGVYRIQVTAKEEEA